MAFHTAHPMTVTSGGVTTWDPNVNYALRGETYDTNGVQLQYTVTADNFWYSAKGTDGKDYRARYCYVSSMTYEEMHGDSDEEPFLNKTNIAMISILALVIIATSGSLIGLYVRF